MDFIEKKRRKKERDILAPSRHILMKKGLKKATKKRGEEGMIMICKKDVIRIFVSPREERKKKEKERRGKREGSPSRPIMTVCEKSEPKCGESEKKERRGDELMV